MAARRLGRDVERSAISALVMPSPISRATSNSRDVSGRHGSSSGAWPRAIRSTASARSASAGDSSFWARARASVADRHRLRVAVRANQALRQVDPRPGCLPRPAVSVPAGDRRLEGDPGDAGGAFGKGDQPSPMGERGARDVGDPFEAVRARGEPGRGLDRPAILEGRADPGHHERHEEHALVDGRRPVEGVAAERRRPLGSPASRATSARPHSGGRIELDLAAGRPERQGVVELGGGRVDLAAGHAPHTRAPSAPCTCRGCSPCRRWPGGRVAGPRPGRRRPTTPSPGSSASRGRNGTARSSRRSARPRRSNALRRA